MTETKNWLETRFKEVYDVKTAYYCSRRTANLQALCKVFEIDSVELMKLTEHINDKFKKYSKLKASATKEFLVNGCEAQYKSQMEMIDRTCNLQDAEWFIYQKNTQYEFF